MKLGINELKQITLGATDIKEEHGAFSFKRFTNEQENLIKNINREHYKRACAPAGIKLSFKTDSKKMFVKIRVEAVLSIRTFFSADVIVNGQAIGYIDNFSDIKLPRDYVTNEFELGEFSKSFELGEGEKDVCIHLPYSVKTDITEISVDDRSFVEGLRYKKKLLAFGDSITQGFDAFRPSNRYTSRLAQWLGAEEFNKGIGGAGYVPALAQLKEEFVPDYITVAYGTNDWGNSDKDTFKHNCNAFYENLSENYPNAKIFALTPIWRKDCNEEKMLGSFDALEMYIREAAHKYENITVISGRHLVPENEEYFADFNLHPNDIGYEHFIKNLIKNMRI